jgi:fucose 4-O-acetylase-like acetyltransferase
MLADKFKLIKDNLFLRVGQNTLVIYIVHVIILYGGIFGIGLYPHILNQSMAPLAAALFSLGFIAFFIGLVWAIEKRESTK